MENLLTVRNASKILGITRIRLYQLIHENRVKPVIIDGVFFISKSEINRVAQERKEKKRS